jgi:hypothetical protein
MAKLAATVDIGRIICFKISKTNILQVNGLLCELILLSLVSKENNSFLLSTLSVDFLDIYGPLNFEAATLFLEHKGMHLLWSRFNEASVFDEKVWPKTFTKEIFKKIIPKLETNDKHASDYSGIFFRFNHL